MRFLSRFVNIGLGIILVGSAIFCWSSWPNKSQLNATKVELSNVNYDANHMPHFKPQIILKKNVSSIKSEQQITKTINDGFTLMFTKIHNENDMKNADYKKQLSNSIGYDWALDIYNQILMRDDGANHIENLKIETGFDNSVTDWHKVPFRTNITYTNTPRNKGKQSHTLVYAGTANLYTNKAKITKMVQIADTPDAAMHY